MYKLRYVFPGALIAFLVMLLLEYLPCLRGGEQERARPRDQKRKQRHPQRESQSRSRGQELPRRTWAEPEEFCLRSQRRWSWRDTALMLAVTAAYAVVAFLGLGDTRGIESFCRFQDRGAYALLELEEETYIGSIRYYCGLNTGAYRLEFSLDGESFTDAGSLEQSYNHLFKWNQADLAEDRTAARFIRLTADGQLYLGELAVYDETGNLLTDRMHWPSGCNRLFDEQELVPEEGTYLNSAYFDEIYHARTAYEHIRNVYPYEVTHPPLGKLILGLGIRVFGMVPFGWRFSGTLIGVLMLPALYLFLKRMFGGDWVPFCGTAVMATDFMHFVQTRIATIDSYSVFFILLMYLFFWLFWQAERRRMRDWLPPLAMSGICFGLGAASKWTCLYAGAGLGLLWLLDRYFRFAALGPERRGEWERETAELAAWSVLFFVLVPAGIYYVSYWPYGVAKGMSGFSMLFSGDYAKLVLDNQRYMFSYHKGVDATHPYSSVWWKWMLDIRPILYYLQYYPEDIHVSFGAFVNPILCWGGLGAMLCMGYRSVRFRDKTALFILVGYLAQLVPWMFVTRVVFEYHYFPSTVFLLLAVCHVLRSLELLPRPKSRWPLFAFTGVSAALFALFYPALRGLPVTRAFGRNFLNWLPSWPF